MFEAQEENKAGELAMSISQGVDLHRMRCGYFPSNRIQGFTNET
jgi:hypothetical protein